MGKEEVISMSAKEAKRLYVIQQVLERKLKQSHAAELLKLSVRQMRRLSHRVREEGPKGIIHRLRGRHSNRRHPEVLRKQALEHYQKFYSDFGPTLACEKLSERDNIRIGRETLRRWLIATGSWSQKRKQDKHYLWRERKACFGEMIQIDGSHHDWLEGRGGKLVLMGYIDDATSTVFARFYDYEGTLPALDSFLRYAKQYGLPQSVYVDRHTTYRSPGKLTITDELLGRDRPQSQFERALAELGVQVIPAYSPQAKGRIERLFKTFQDRLIKEMRLAQINTRDEANDFLGRYLPTYNSRFGLPARNPVNLHRRLPPQALLKHIFCVRKERALCNDNTLQHEGKIYLLKDRWINSRPKTIQTELRLNGKLYLLNNDRMLRYQEIPKRPQKPRLTRRPPQGSQRRHMPKQDHPWKQYDQINRLKQLRNRTFLTSIKQDISIGR